MNVWRKSLLFSVIFFILELGIHFADGFLMKYADTISREVEKRTIVIDWMDPPYKISVKDMELRGLRLIFDTFEGLEKEENLPPLNENLSLRKVETQEDFTNLVNDRIKHDFSRVVRRGKKSERDTVTGAVVLLMMVTTARNALIYLTAYHGKLVKHEDSRLKYKLALEYELIGMYLSSFLNASNELAPLFWKEMLASVQVITPDLDDEISSIIQEYNSFTRALQNFHNNYKREGDLKQFDTLLTAENENICRFFAKVLFGEVVNKITNISWWPHDAMLKVTKNVKDIIENHEMPDKLATITRIFEENTWTTHLNDEIPPLVEGEKLQLKLILRYGREGEVPFELRFAIKLNGVMYLFTGEKLLESEYHCL